ncbi:hypothetical protein SDC9_107161 [bioreactor metagenome]|uniref:Uncharacterized protein n=1 Tax=bioreactor metagenome TaxID=1076179 RepID=A0A645B4B9_9ZZZZ
MGPRGKRLSDTAGKAGGGLLHVGELVDLVQGKGHRGIVDLGIIVLQISGEGFDLLLRIGNGAFNGDHVLHILCLGKEGLEPLQFCLLRPQPPGRVVVCLADVLHIGIAGYHMAQLSCPADKLVEFLLGNSSGVIPVPVTGAVVIHTAALHPAVQLIHQSGKALCSVVKRGSLHA